MFDHTHYVPALLWKAAEHGALSELESNVRSHVTPVIQLVPGPFKESLEGRPEVDRFHGTSLSTQRANTRSRASNGKYGMINHHIVHVVGQIMGWPNASTTLSPLLGASANPLP